VHIFTRFHIFSLGDVDRRFDGLIDAESSLISRRIFMEPEIYARELERIFAPPPLRYPERLSKR